jgi:hypothetical protein
MGIWEDRFRELADTLALAPDPGRVLIAVYRMLDEAKAFRSQRTAEAARWAVRDICLERGWM